ncbi:MAG: hypothetical protein ABDH49_08485 [Candidatus Hydrothermales bacterium]
MKKLITLVFIFTLGLKDREHPGVIEKIRPDDVRKAITDYINKDIKLKGGYFLIWDKEIKQVWRLNFKELHKEVRVLSDGTYFMCADFKETDGEKNS